jgi:hypothetical protein
LSNTPDLNNPDQTFQVIHPFHPLHGRRLALVVYQHSWGDDRVYFYHDRGCLIGLPVQWTSLSPPDPFVVLSAERSAFRPIDLLALVRLIEDLRGGGDR